MPEGAPVTPAAPALVVVRAHGARPAAPGPALVVVRAHAGMPAAAAPPDSSAPSNLEVWTGAAWRPVRTEIWTGAAWS